MSDNPQDTPAIELIALKKTYAATKKAEAKTALHGIDLTIPRAQSSDCLVPTEQANQPRLTFWPVS